MKNTRNSSKHQQTSQQSTNRHLNATAYELSSVQFPAQLGTFYSPLGSPTFHSLAKQPTHKKNSSMLNLTKMSQMQSNTQDDRTLLSSYKKQYVKTGNPSKKGHSISRPVSSSLVDGKPITKSKPCHMKRNSMQHPIIATPSGHTPSTEMFQSREGSLKKSYDLESEFSQI